MNKWVVLIPISMAVSIVLVSCLDEILNRIAIRYGTKVTGNKIWLFFMGNQGVKI